MDTGEGSMRMLEEDEFRKIKNPSDLSRIFSVGEEVAVKASRFRITKITTKKITLRILPRV